ncbi:right-handed parallel beta-helix repeat-containing protein [Sphingobacterium sp. GVS05A]|uniref:right-handed parallel beta-helix repeat-containing protein n=1 Tax=Sphingobacterium sp. GVS05A TaxID=2862679 RepID=UPI001CBE696D|nr:right-handed parallel beta-helix repeat-containing protein [Sphingobacterium sp. GVS05A]
MANQFLVKETMAAMQGLSAAEITALQNGTYEGVQLLGYYEKGDTPAPIIYYLAPTTPDPGPDDGGSVITVSGVKLVHEFCDRVDVSYFGAIGGVADCLERINRAIAYAESSNVNIVEVSQNVLLSLPVSYDAFGIIMKSHVYLELNATIAIRANDYERYAIILFSNVTDSGVFGRGRIVGDIETHTGTLGEWGNGINISDGCKDISVQDITIEQCWGDGIWVGGARTATNASSNISVNHIIVDKNGRQGITVTKGSNISISKSTISNTGTIKGKLPMDGIDIEPNENNRVSNVNIYDNTFLNNVGHDFETNCMQPNTEIKNVNFYNNTILSNSEKASIVSALIKVNAERFKEDMVVKNINIKNNHLSFETKETHKITTFIYCYGSAKLIDISSNTFATSLDITSIKLDTVFDVVIASNFSWRSFHFVLCQTEVQGLTVHANTVDTLMHAMVSAGNSSRIKVYSNTINKQIGTSVMAYNYSNCSDLFIYNNSSSNLSMGFFSNSGMLSNCIVKGNVINNFNSSGRANGPCIYVTGVAASTNIVIEDNTILQSANALSVGIRASLSLSETYIKNNILIGQFAQRISNETGASVKVLDQNITLEANNSEIGLVKKSVGVAGSASPLPGTVADSVANTLPEVVANLNTLIDKYNDLRNLTSEIRGSLNAKLIADRASGQQA